VKVKASEAHMILIAGPYRSGTNDDPDLIKKNVQQMEAHALPIFRAGHIPILGEWLALPLVELMDLIPLSGRSASLSVMSMICPPQQIISQP